SDNGIKTLKVRPYCQTTPGPMVRRLPAPAGADAGMRQLQGRALEFPDLEDFRPAVRADALDGWATVFHGHLFGVLNLDLLALFDAVPLRHEGSSFRCRYRGKARYVCEVD